MTDGWISNPGRSAMQKAGLPSGDSALSVISQDSKARAVDNRRRMFSPLTLYLVLFFLINCFTVNVALKLTGSSPTAFDYTAFDYTALDCALKFYRGNNLGDSWDHMRWAMKYTEENPGKSCYGRLFHRLPVRFQYPPTSLLWFKLLYDGGLDSNHELNRLSRKSLILAALIVVCIYYLSLKRYVWSNGSLGWPDKMANTLLALCFALTFYPWMWSYHLGQIQSWIDLFFACLVLAWILGKKGLAGALAGLICTIKPQLGLFLLWALWRKQWRFATGWLIVFVPFLSASILTYGIPMHEDYLNVLSFLTSHGESFCRNQSVNGILHRLMFNGVDIANKNQCFPPYNAWVHAGTVISSLFILAFAFFWRRKEHKAAEATDMMIAALSFTMAAPVVWEHHYGIVLPMFAMVLPLTMAKRRSFPGILAVGVSYVLLSNCFPFTDHLAATYFNIFQSYWFFGGLLLLVCLYRLRSAQQSMDLSGT